MNIQEKRNWNMNHKTLTNAILKKEKHKESIQLFLSQHSLLHSSSFGKTTNTTLEDVLLQDLKETVFRQYPATIPDTKNSIAWHYWHIARIEDMTMNILIADDNQIFHSENWSQKLNVPFLHSGNDMTPEEIRELSENICLTSLIDYRKAVGIKTRVIVSSLKPGQLNDRIEQIQINRLFEEQAISKKSTWLAEYWGKKTVAGLILMPATRHNFLHLNKCIRIKEKWMKRE